MAGAKPGERRGGRQKGTPNKVTAERIRKAKHAYERALLEEEAERTGDAWTKAKAAGAALMKDIAFEFAKKFASLAAYYQPWPDWVHRMEKGQPVYDSRENAVLDNANPHYDEEKFKFYAKLAADTAIAAAPFQTPRYSAVMVGASVVTKIEVVGGFPDEFAAPLPTAVQIPPGTIIDAEADLALVIEPKQDTAAA